MSTKPDYTRLRGETSFEWGVGSSYDTLLELTGIPIKDFYLNPEAGIEAYRKGRPLLLEMFGPDVPPPMLATPHISYGHVNCLGAELKFPEGGEVCNGVPFATLEEGIEVLKQDIDFTSAGMTQFYIDYQKKMSDAFDGESCYFAFGPEGPLTTAYTLRGHDIFFDPYDNPELFREFMELLTQSIVEYNYFYREINGYPRANSEAAGLCDDVASMFKPMMWPEYVLPFWEQYYNGLTTGARYAHVEDLRVEQLHFLEDIGLSVYDPSISRKINPKIITEACRVPFQWRLGSIHYPNMSCQDVEDFVFQAVADGASSVYGDACQPQCDIHEVKKVHSFMKAAREVERMLNEGASREDLSKCVSESGKQKFWNHWPE